MRGRAGVVTDAMTLIALPAVSRAALLSACLGARRRSGNCHTSTGASRSSLLLGQMSLYFIPSLATLDSASADPGRHDFVCHTFIVTSATDTDERAIHGDRPTNPAGIPPLDDVAPFRDLRLTIFRANPASLSANRIPRVCVRRVQGTRDCLQLGLDPRTRTRRALFVPIKNESGRRSTEDAGGDSVVPIDYA
jgi:hypothetical protein